MNLTRLLVKSLKKFQSNVYYSGAGVFLATAFSDFIWAKYVLSIAEQRGLVAAGWSIMVIVLGAYVVVSYVDDKRLILPAALGAALGTYLGV